MSESNQLIERPQTVKDYLALPAYRDRFHEVMGKRANQFMASIVACANMPGLKDAEPRSVIAAAMVSATLDLPVNPTLGMAHIVAYGDRTGAKVAQFQIGYKGFIQLALRSGQYKRLNAGPVNEEVFAGYDIVGEPSLDWMQYDPTKPTTGYFCAFEMLNGFTKVVYWPRKQVEQHAKRFSKAYQKGYQSSPWVSDFDAMATKTVIKAALTKWGYLSVEMQKAASHDQAVQTDVDAEPTYIDATPLPSDGEMQAEEAPKRPAPPKRNTKGVAAVVENTDRPEPDAPAPVIDLQPEPEAAPTPEPTPVPAPEPEPAKATAANKPTVDESDFEPTPEDKRPKATRTSLNDGEQYSATVEVVEVTPFTANVKKGNDRIPTPSVSAVLKGEYEGTVMDIGGGIKKGDEVIPANYWKVGARLSVELIGKLNKASGNVGTRVESAKPLEAPAGNAAVEVE